MKGIFIIGASITFLIISCQRKNSIEFNIIVFKDPVNNVYDSILKLNNLLDRLPASNGDVGSYVYTNSNEHIEQTLENDNVLYIGDYLINEKNIDTLKLLSVFTSSEKREFLTLTKYLKENFLLGAGYQVNGAGMWSYGYRGSCEKGFNECRTIIALKSLSDTLQIMYGSFDKIIDRKDKACFMRSEGSKNILISLQKGPCGLNNFSI